MAVELHWYNNAQTILMVHYPDRWTWDDYIVAFNEAKRMIEMVKHEVCVIQYSDVGFKYMPTGAALPHMKQVSERRPHNMLKSFLVVDADLSRNFIEMLLKVLPANRQRQPNVFVASIEEALAQIAKTSTG